MNSEQEIIHHLVTMCEECGFCKFDVVCTREKTEYVIHAGYCDNGSGYINVDRHNKDDKYIDSRKMKKSTDTSFPYSGLKLNSVPDCGCNE